MGELCYGKAEYPKTIGSFIKSIYFNSPWKADFNGMRKLVQRIKRRELVVGSEYKRPSIADLIRALYSNRPKSVLVWYDKEGNKIATEHKLSNSPYESAVYDFKTKKLIGYIRQFMGLHYFDLCGRKVYQFVAPYITSRSKLCSRRAKSSPSNSEGMHNLIKNLEIDFSKLPNDSGDLRNLLKVLNIDKINSVMFADEYDIVTVKNNDGVLAKAHRVTSYEWEVYNGKSEYVGSIIFNSKN